MPREVDTQVARVELPLCAAAARVEGRAALVLGVREAGPATETQRMLGLWWHVGVDALARPETASQGQRSQSVAGCTAPRCPRIRPPQRKKSKNFQADGLDTGADRRVLALTQGKKRRKAQT